MVEPKDFELTKKDTKDASELAQVKAVGEESVPVQTDVYTILGSRYLSGGDIGQFPEDTSQVQHELRLLQDIYSGAGACGQCGCVEIDFIGEYDNVTEPLGAWLPVDVVNPTLGVRHYRKAGVSTVEIQVTGAPPNLTYNIVSVHFKPVPAALATAARYADYVVGKEEGWEG